MRLGIGLLLAATAFAGSVSKFGSWLTCTSKYQMFGSLVAQVSVG